MINPSTLRTARTTAGLSQRRLAREVGLNYQVIRRLEAGGDDSNLTLRDLKNISRCLQTTAAGLLTTAAPTPPPHLTGDTELTADQAHLLRQIQKGNDVRRTLTTISREIHLPHLLRTGVLAVSDGGAIRLSEPCKDNMDEPM